MKKVVKGCGSGYGSRKLSVSALSLLLAFSVGLGLVGLVQCGNPDAKRLYDDLLSNYNKLVRPVVNVSEAVMVRLKLKLSQLIDVVRREKNIYRKSIMRLQSKMRTISSDNVSYTETRVVLL